MESVCDVAVFPFKGRNIQLLRLFNADGKPLLIRSQFFEEVLRGIVSLKSFLNKLKKLNCPDVKASNAQASMMRSLGLLQPRGNCASLVPAAYAEKALRMQSMDEEHLQAFRKAVVDAPRCRHHLHL